VTVLALWGALLIGGIYMTRAIRGVLHGPLPEQWQNLSDAGHLWRKLPYALLLAGLLLFGFVPKLLTDKIYPDADKIVKLATAAPVGETLLPAGPTGGAAPAPVTGALPQTELENRN
jgi:NADH:ubiquinone oxidoreductase subunit 4 (subunit M)